MTWMTFMPGGNISIRHRQRSGSNTPLACDSCSFE